MPVSVDNQLQAVEQHEVDALCAAVTVTLGRREQVDFSLPDLPGRRGCGGALRRPQAPAQHPERRGHASTRPTWRAVALNILREQVFTAVPGTTAEQWLKERGRELQVEFALTPAPSYEAGIQAVLDRKASAFFAERAILLDAVMSHKAGDDLTVLDRQFTYEPLALPIAAGRRRLPPAGGPDLEQAVLRPPAIEARTRSGSASRTRKPKIFFRWNALPE